MFIFFRAYFEMEVLFTFRGVRSREFMTVESGPGGRRDSRAGRLLASRFVRQKRSHLASYNHRRDVYVTEWETKITIPKGRLACPGLATSTAKENSLLLDKTLGFPLNDINKRNN